jgi:UDP-GlcNAc3NAcA epimerase
MKVVSIVGARPQLIKAAAISRKLRQSSMEVLVHTGQHYDSNMSDIFFEELDIPRPDFNLGVGSGSQGAQTGEMLRGIEEVLVRERPDVVLIYGDTNSTLAGALAAAKLHMPVAHVEAGLRSFNRRMPEEINRIVSDHVSDLLFCPSETAVNNLTAEGLTRGVHLVGDIMLDIFRFAQKRALTQSTIREQLELDENAYYLVTVHRAENTDDPERLQSIFAALNQIEQQIIFPVHPRTRKLLDQLAYAPSAHIRLIDPVGYLDMVALTQYADRVLTDSGGLQKEAYWAGVRCITLRDETEWVETTATGWNLLAGTGTDAIIRAVNDTHVPGAHPDLYGDGQTARGCIALLEEFTMQRAL